MSSTPITRPAKTSYSTSTPERTLAQRRDALAKANRRRLARARFKREFLARPDGRVTATTLIVDQELPEGFDFEDFRTMPLLDVLKACRWIGKVRAIRVINLAKVSPAKTVGGLTPRQRRIVGMLLEMGGHKEWLIGDYTDDAAALWLMDRQAA